MSQAQPIFWCKTNVIDEIVYNMKREKDMPPYSQSVYEEMCKEPVFDPSGRFLGNTHNYPYFVAYDDGKTATVYEREFKKQFDGYKIPDMEMTPERQEIIDSFIKKVHGI
jgi:hypothetical protein